MADCRGFSLIEVVVAFAILSVALGVLLQIFGSSMRDADLAGAYGEATQLAESELARLGVEEALAEGAQAGAFNDKYRWEREVVPYETEREDQRSLLPARLYRITLRVSWGEVGRERTVSMRTLRLVSVP